MKNKLNNTKYLIAGIVFTSVAILIVVFLLVNNSSKSNIIAPQPPKEYFWDKISDIRFTDNNNVDIDMNQYKGKPVLINMWATWCSFCVEELPDFDKLQSEYKDQVVILAVNRAESKNDVENFINSNNVNNLTILTDKEDKLYVKVGGFSMPETLFINKDGYLQIHKRGFMKYDEMKQLADSIL